MNQGKPTFSKDFPSDPLKGFGSPSPADNSAISGSVADHAALETGVHGAGTGKVMRGVGTHTFTVINDGDPFPSNPETGDIVVVIAV